MAPADQHEAVGRRGPAPSRSRATSATSGCGREFDRARWGPQHLGEPRLQRPEVDAVRSGLEPLAASARPGRRRTPSPYGAEPQHHVEPALVAGPRRSSIAVSSSTVAAGDRRVRVGGLLGQRRRDDLLVDQRRIARRPGPQSDQGEARQDLAPRRAGRRSGSTGGE